MTLWVWAQVLSQHSWQSCLSSVSHSQPLDHVSSCSETWRIWVGKYSHVWQCIALLRQGPSHLFFYFPPLCASLPSCSLFLYYLVLSSLAFLFTALLLPPEVSHCFPKKKVLLRATFSKNDAVVSKPPQSGKHMFLLHWSEGNWSNRSFFPMLEMKCTYVPTNAHIECMHTHTQP